MWGSVADFIICKFLFQILSAKEKSTRSFLDLVLWMHLTLTFSWKFSTSYICLSNKQSQITGLHIVSYLFTICTSLKWPTNLRLQKNQNSRFYCVIHEVEQNKSIFFRCAVFSALSKVFTCYFPISSTNMNSDK